MAFDSELALWELALRKATSDSAAVRAKAIASLKSLNGNSDGTRCNVSLHQPGHAGLAPHISCM
ncbi:hypothetical protein E4U47_001051 [Claviceps purpurea]|nr:hypothetical protein E4U47_001051 [Claviceps purpurea]